MDGQLAKTRALGDEKLKEHIITSEPDTFLESNDSGSQFIILASDGLWKVNIQPSQRHRMPSGPFANHGAMNDHVWQLHYPSSFLGNKQTGLLLCYVLCQVPRQGITRTTV